MSYSLVILSDLHIGADDDFDIFRSDDKASLLHGFLQYVRQRATPVELILNGDFVDFLQLRPWDDFSRATAVRKITTIASANAEIFEAFGEILEDGRHRIKILLGNHDVELAYPEVWAVLRDAIKGSAGERLQLFNFRSTYNVEVNGILAHVEHGNAGDPWNAINYFQLFNDAEQGTEHFVYPPGSQFVFETINLFKEQLKFVDVLKPQIPAVLLLLLALRPRLAATALPGTLRRALDALGNSVLIRLRQKLAGPGFKADSAAGPESPLAEDLAVAAYLEAGGDLEFSDTQDLEHFLESKDLGPAGKAVFGPGSNKIRLRLMAAALRTLERFRARGEGEKFFQRDHPENWAAGEAQKRLEGKVRLVVFGHTHEALKTEFPQGVYVNSGAWANLVSLPLGNDPALLEWLGKLASDTFERTSSPTYVTVDPAEGGVLVRLNLWTPKGEQVLWQKII